MAICKARKLDGKPCWYEGSYVLCGLPFCGIHVRAIRTEAAQVIATWAQPQAEVASR